MTNHLAANLDACAACGTRHCHMCGTDLTDGMGVMRWAPDGLAGVHRIPGLLCVDCNSEIRAGDPDPRPACPSVYTVTVHSGRDTFTARADTGHAALIPADSADTGPTQVDALFSAKQIPHTNHWSGVVWIDGTPHECRHVHSGFRSAKSCGDLRAWVDRQADPTPDLTVAECDAILAHEHELPAVCPHGRTAADRTVTPCPSALAGCVTP